MPGNCSHGFHPGEAYNLIKATWNLEIKASQISWSLSAVWQEVPGKEELSTGVGLPASSASLQPPSLCPPSPVRMGATQSAPLCFGKTD